MSVLSIDICVLEESDGGYCFNGGTCEVKANGPVCFCTDSYEGDRCQDRQGNWKTAMIGCKL